jgi:hypothetical protein
MSRVAAVRPGGALLRTQVMGALLGAAFFVWVAGFRIISPVDYEWAMKYDWRIHFLGWQMFRSEPWGWPPGLVSGYYHAPSGTSIGYTDSLPIVAFVLKPFSALLPQPFQYLGLWLTMCFAAQGWWGARLAGFWTRNSVAQLCAAALLVLTPTLLNRAAHPALCAQWLLLWATGIYLRWRPGDRVPLLPVAALGLIAGLVHPYLAVMILAVLSALAVRTWIQARDAAGIGAFAAATILVVAGWWASGLFIVPGGAMVRPGLGLFSMNLLSVITPAGWSAFLPQIPTGADGQAFEGFQYLGLGLLFLLAAALAASRRVITARRAIALAPLLVLCVLCAGFALSPRITLADTVVADFSHPLLDRLAVFGVTGRFFWPAAYTLIVLAVATVTSGFSARTAAGVLIAAVLLQVADLRPAFSERRALTRTTEFHTWPGAPRSPVWSAALPHYDHLVLVPPLQCGPAPVTFELPAFLGGLYGLTVNVGEVARASEPDRARYCVELERTVAMGTVEDRSVYLVYPANEARMRAKAPSLRCGTVEGLRVCVTARSYEAWRNAASFE